MRLLQLVDPGASFEHAGVTLAGYEAKRFPNNAIIKRALSGNLVKVAEEGTEETPTPEVPATDAAAAEKTPQEPAAPAAGPTGKAPAKRVGSEA